MPPDTSSQQPRTYTQSVDVCLCTYRRPTVTDTLASLAKQSLPEGWVMRIIVADNDDTPSARAAIEQALTDYGIDGVYIGLPNGLHAEWTIRAARAGKHVLCEKPLSRRAADVDRMAAACADAGVVLMEAFMYRLHPTWVAIRELVATGRIGKLMAMQSWFGY